MQTHRETFLFELWNEINCSDSWVAESDQGGSARTRMAACVTIKRSDSAGSIGSSGLGMKRSNSFDRLNEMKRTPSMGKIGMKRIGSREKLAQFKPASPARPGHRQTLSRSNPSMRRSWTKLNELATIMGPSFGNMTQPAISTSTAQTSTHTHSTQTSTTSYEIPASAAMVAAVPVARPITRSASRELLNKHAGSESGDGLAASNELFTSITPGVPGSVEPMGRPLTRSASRDILHKSSNDLSAMQRTDSWAALMSPANMPRNESFSKVFGSCGDLAELNSLGSCGDLDTEAIGVDAKHAQENGSTKTPPDSGPFVDPATVPSASTTGISHAAMISQALHATSGAQPSQHLLPVCNQPAANNNNIAPRYQEPVLVGPAHTAPGGRISQQRASSGAPSVEAHMRQSPMMNPQARFQTPLEMALSMGGTQSEKSTSTSQDRQRQHRIAQERLRTIQYASSGNVDQDCVAVPLSAIVGYNRDMNTPQELVPTVLDPQYLQYPSYTLIPKNSPAYLHAVEQGLVPPPSPQQQQQQHVSPHQVSQQGPFANFPPEIAHQIQYHQQQQILLAAMARQQGHMSVQHNIHQPQQRQPASINPGHPP